MVPGRPWQTVKLVYLILFTCKTNANTYTYLASLSHTQLLEFYQCKYTQVFSPTLTKIHTWLFIGVGDGGDTLAVDAVVGHGAGGVEAGHPPLAKSEARSPRHLGEHRLLAPWVVHVDLPRCLRL